MRFRSFRSRLVVVFLGLFVVIQATGYVVVGAFVHASARRAVEEELRLASTLFARQFEVRSQQLVAATRLLSGDFALKTAVATADHATTASVLENHRRRVDADILMLASLDGGVVADTRRPTRPGAIFPAPRLIAEAEAGRGVSDVVTIDGRLYQFAVVPLLAPEPIAWLGAGFAIDDKTAVDLRRLSGLQVSFVAREDGGAVVHASTLGAADREALARQLPLGRKAGVMHLGSGEHLLRVEPLGQNVVVVLQQPLAAHGVRHGGRGVAHRRRRVRAAARRAPRGARSAGRCLRLADHQPETQSRLDRDPPPPLVPSKGGLLWND